MSHVLRMIHIPPRRMRMIVGRVVGCVVIDAGAIAGCDVDNCVASSGTATTGPGRSAGNVIARALWHDESPHFTGPLSQS
jgi:hypothetical protein